MIKSDRKVYDHDMQKWAIHAIDKVRSVVFLGPRQMAGPRFKNDEYVLATLESHTEQAEFEAYPLVKIEKALREAASADYWYQKEEDYGNRQENAEAEAELSREYDLEYGEANDGY